jgi:hypothetical protein
MVAVGPGYHDRARGFQSQWVPLLVFWELLLLVLVIYLLVFCGCFWLWSPQAPSAARPGVCLAPAGRSAGWRAAFSRSVTSVIPWPVHLSKRVIPGIAVRRRLGCLRLGLRLCRLPRIVDPLLTQRAADGLKVVDDHRHVSRARLRYPEPSKPIRCCT